MKKVISIFMALAVAVCYVVPANIAVVQAEKTEADTAEQTQQVSIMFTNDMHSHMDSDEIEIDGEQEDVGGFARIKTVKDQLEEVYPGTYLVDAGGFSMGTAFQTIYRTEAPELVTMGKIGYDGTVLGNSEFDYNTEGVADMLNAAVKSAGDREELPVITGLNIDWKKTLKDDKTKTAGKKLKAAFDNYGVQDYTIVEKNGVKIALFGIMGDDAISCIPNAKVYFTDYIERAKQIVKEIEQNGEADMIVCLSHSGTGVSEEDFDGADDVRLAEEVKGIDMIVSGHNSIAFKKPKTVGDTVIASCGEFNQNVGHVVFNKDSDGKFELKKYELISLHNDVEKDFDIQHVVDRYKAYIDDQYFADYGYRYDEVLAENNIDFTPIAEFGQEQKEDTLGNLIADSYVYTVNQTEKGKKNNKPVDVAVIAENSVRNSFNKGDITVSDAFGVSSLGVGEDGTVGYPVVSIYLTGKELKHLAEVDASLSQKMPEARMYTSGLGYTINKFRMPLNKASNISLVNKNGKTTAIDGDKLYRVVGGIEVCQRLSQVNEQSHGLLSIEPKNRQGKVITDLNTAIVKDKNGNELKEWYAVANYIDSFDNHQIPKYYSSEQGRKVMDNSLNPIKIFKQPNHVAIMMFAIALIPIVIIVGIVLAIIKSRHRRRGYAKSIFSGSKNRNYNRVISSRSHGVRPARHTMNMSSKKRRGRKRKF